MMNATNKNDPNDLDLLVREKISEEAQTYFGNVGEHWVEYAVSYFLDTKVQERRIADLVEYGFGPASKVLDVAAGCGQFMFKALDAGYDCYGIEPEDWKLDYVCKKLLQSGRPSSDTTRIVSGVGESLPFPDDFFDGVSSLNTLEHVQDPRKVISEMLRVVKVGGGVHIRCPDYRSTVEGHYRLPWLPLMPRALAKLYLRLLGRPVLGLRHIQYVTKPRIKRWLTDIEREQNGLRLIVFDGERIGFENELRRRRLPLFPSAFFIWKLARFIGHMFRKKMSVNVFVRVVAK
jgi:ubiquinone/menaquinone biosynthesis C-methylase UbiE